MSSTNRFSVRTVALRTAALLGAATMGLAAAGAAESRPPDGATPTSHNVRDFGATGDGKSKDTAAIQRAIDAAARAGGGTVRLPAGAYVSGTLDLRSHVGLHLERGAVLLASTDAADYPPRVPALRSYTDNYVTQALIYAEKVEHVGVTGPGIIDGRGSAPTWRCTHGNPRYRERPYLIRFVECRGVTVREVTLTESPMWTQHYLACEDIVIEDIRVSGFNLNNDMLDLDGCRNVRVSGLTGDTLDDAITLKSTLDRPCRDITITNCVVSTWCNGIKFGTESNGGFENIAISNIAVRPSGKLDDQGKVSPGLAAIALEIVDGGRLDGVTITNVAVQGTRAPIFMRLGNRARPFKEGMAPPPIGIFRNVSVSHVVATGAGSIGCSITGLPGHPIENVSLHDIRIVSEGGGTAAQAAAPVPENEARYPESTMFGPLPAYGLFARHVEGISLDGIDVRCARPDDRPALVFDDVRGLAIAGTSASCTERAPAVLVLRGVAGAMLRGCRVPSPAGCFLRLAGNSRDVSVIGNDLSRAARPFELEPGVTADVLFAEANRVTGR